MFLFCLTESETTDSVPSDEENAEVSVLGIFSNLEQGLKNNVLRYSSPFSISLSVSGVSILIIAGGEKEVQGRQAFEQEGSRKTGIWMVVPGWILLQVLSSSSVQTTGRLICIIRCSGEPSAVPASLLI